MTKDQKFGLVIMIVGLWASIQPVEDVPFSVIMYCVGGILICMGALVLKDA